MSRQPSRSRTFRLILTVTLVPLWVACDGRIVEPPGPTTITISPSSATLHSIDDTVQLSAVVHDQNGQVMPEAPVWWAGSEPSVAAINTTGMVTAARNGRANVTASVGAVSATAVITVAQVVAEVSVSPSADTLVALEGTVRLVGVARDANGHLIDGATFNWASSDASVASVDISGLVTAARNGGATVIARAGAVSANVEIFVEQEVVELRVSPSADTLVAFGDTVRLVAEAQDANGHLIDGVVFSWASNEPSVAPVDISGLVTAVGNGGANVIAQAGAASARVAILVKQRVVEVIVSPSAHTLVAFGDTVRLGAEARDANGHVVEGATFSWASSDPRVAMVDTSGLVSVVGSGRARVTTSAGAVSATAEITVAQGVADVSVSPSAHTLVALADTVRLAAEARDANGYLIDGATFNWSSTDASVASVDISGLVTAARNGGATVIARAGAVSANVEIFVEQEVVELRVSPSADTLVAFGDTVRLVAEAQDANGHLIDGVVFSWASNEPSVAPVDISGLVTAVGNGGANVIAQAGAASARVAILVKQRVVEVIVSPSAHTLVAFGDTVRLGAEARDANGHVVEEATFSWASSDPRVAMVDTSGLVSVVGSGRARVTTSAGAVSATAEITVAQGVADVSVSPSAHTLVALGDTVRLAAEARDANGYLIEATAFSWASSDASTAPVDALGLVTALGNGRTTVTASVGAVSATAEITVVQGVVDVSVSPSADTLVAFRDTVRLVAQARDANGHDVEGATFSWASSDPSVAVVDGSGLVSATGEGTAEINAASGQFRATATIVVESPDRAVLRSFYEAAKGADWENNDNWLSGKPLDEWHGVTVDAHGRVVGLDLSGNGLTGSITPQIGNLPYLRTLNLQGNALGGSIPPEIGSLANLEALILGSGSSETNRLAGPLPPELGSLRQLMVLALTGIETLAGALPATLLALTQLESLYADDTGLCAPLDSSFRAWLETVRLLSIAHCVPSMAYLTQAVQSREFDVTLVAGEKALLRVFPIAQVRTTEGIPTVSARFYRNGRETYAVDLPGESTAIPTSLDEGDLSNSANAEIPGSVMHPGLELVIEIDSESTLDAELGVSRRIPETGRLAVDVLEMPLLDLTQIPFLWSSDPDSSIVDLINAMSKDPENHEMLWDTRTLLPTGDMYVTAHEPVVTLTNNAYDLLSQTSAIRALEGGTGYYMGMMSGTVTPRNIGGVAYLSYPASFSRPHASTVAHELGHNLSLGHAPCGGPSRVDPNFPYSDGAIGVWGYDFREGGGLVPPSTRDLMSYCEPEWVSDYHFTKALRFRMEVEETDSAQSFVSPTKSLLLWGGIGPDGVPFLEPAVVVNALPRLPRPGDEHRLTGRTRQGAELFSLTFDMLTMADGDGRSGFAFVLPVQTGWETNLASITLAGSGGSVTIDRDSELSMAILLNARNGQVRAILRDLPSTIQSRADAAAAFGSGPGLSVLFSQGIPGVDAWK